MEFWIGLGLFAAKAFIIVLTLAAILILILAVVAKARGSSQKLEVENLNEHFDQQALALKSSILTEKELKQELKQLKKKIKEEAKNPSDKKRIFVLDFVGDIRASRLESLREEVTAILSVADPKKDEVVVKVESPGGMVHTYGLASSQLVRLRDAGMTLTICIDKVAASGGYLMACTATKIVGAPFAIVGSIGVVAQLPNFHRLLKKHDVDYEEVTAGEFKRTVSMFGEITPKGRQKFLEQIEDTHTLFKDYVKTYRPQLQLEKVATGEYWYGKQAIELGLIDEISSSDDYLFKQRETAKIYKIETHAKKKFAEVVAENISSIMQNSLAKVLQSSNNSHWL